MKLNIEPCEIPQICECHTIVIVWQAKISDIWQLTVCDWFQIFFFSIDRYYDSIELKYKNEVYYAHWHTSDREGVFISSIRIAE